MSPTFDSRIINRKQVHRLGFVSYHMYRPLDDGRQYQFVIHFSPADVAKGRKYVADRLRSARRDIAIGIKEATK